MSSPQFKVGMGILLGIIILALFAPWLAPYSPLLDHSGFENLPPSWALHGENRFLLGTDPLGRDILSRLIFGARYCLGMGVSSVLMAILIGVPLGMWAGYHRRIGFYITKLTDILMSFPAILIAIVVVAVLGPGIVNAVIAVGLTNIPIFIRLTRTQVKAEIARDYVKSAEALGASHTRILFVHIFPNILSSLLVLSSLSLGTAILESAALSFLNLGATPPAPEWGSMIRSGMETFLSTNPWISIFSGTAIFLNVLGFNLLGDALRDHFDPVYDSVR